MFARIGSLNRPSNRPDRARLQDPKSLQNPKSLRRTLRAAAVVLFVPLMLLTSQAEAAIEAYLDQPSVVQGGSVQIYASTDAATFSATVRERATGQIVYSISGQAGLNQTIPPNAYEGPNWQPSLTLSVPATWAPGLYRIVLESGSADATLDLIVRSATAGSVSDIVLIDNLTTRAAYNSWGGRSQYDFNSQGGTRAGVVSYRRPGNGVVELEIEEFAGWAQDMNIPIEFASMLDLHHLPTLLSAYSTVVFAGHSEYWSKEMRDAFDAFVAAGGNAVILSGNTMWWQIRVNGSDQICYKDASQDPLTGVDDERVTVNWFAPPVNDPENRSIGASWRNGGYANYGATFPAAQGYGGYTIVRPDHWLFEGTGLEEGDTFGQRHTIVGYETDGALIETIDGLPIPTGLDGTPLDYEIVGTSLADTGSGLGLATPGTLAVPGGGEIFNAATIDWADGLWSLPRETVADHQVSLATYNILRRFSSLDAPLAVGLSSDSIVRSVPQEFFVYPKGGEPPYQYAVTSGTLPAGLSLDADTGLVSGITTQTTSAPLTVTVSDANDHSVPISFTLSIVDVFNYWDGEDGTATVWDIYDAHPAGATFENVFDAARGSQVLQSNGLGTGNGFRLGGRQGVGGRNGTPWRNEVFTEIEWSMNFDAPYILYLDVETTAGHRYMQYTPATQAPTGLGEYVVTGLGPQSTDGTWRDYSRDVQADLEAAQPGVEILEFNAFLFRGSGRIDDIRLVPEPANWAALRMIGFLGLIAGLRREH